MKLTIIFALALAFLTGACSHKKSQQENMETNSSIMALVDSTDVFLLVGTYTSEEGSKGIYVYKLNAETGKADSVSMVSVANPSYLALSADEEFVYAVSENGDENSAANAFAFDKEKGTLKLLNSSNTEGASPCYIEIDRAGKNVFTANYGGGSITSFQVKEDGTLSPANLVISFDGSGPDEDRQKSPHLHSVRFSPDERFLFAADLGTDKIYRFDAVGSVFEGQPAITRGSLKTFSTPSGAGPRHFDFHPGWNYFYVLGELSGEVIVYDYNQGDLAQKQTIAADTVGARGSADIHVSLDGKFLYASNRLKADGVAIFSIHADDGTLTKVGYQPTARHPRNFVITPNGKLLLVASRDDNKVQVFSIDNQTGLLTDTGHDIHIDKPVCLKVASL